MCVFVEMREFVNRRKRRKGLAQEGRRRRDGAITGDKRGRRIGGYTEKGEVVPHGIEAGRGGRREKK